MRTDPEAVEQALKQIAALYKIEDQIREHNLSGERKRQHRLTHSKPKVDAFFEWIDGNLSARACCRVVLLPKRSAMRASGAWGWRSFWRTRMSKWTRTTSSAPYV